MATPGDANGHPNGSTIGTDEQDERTQKLVIENNYFVGGAVNPRGNDQKITDDGDHIVFSGFKHFNTGGVVSDPTVLEGVGLSSAGQENWLVYEDTDQHIFALAPTKQPAIQFSHNWDNVGLRLTESGSVGIRPPKRQSRAFWQSHGQLYSYQLYSNFYFGIALGARDFASLYTAKNTRSWPYTPHPVANGAEEPYILRRYGFFFAHLQAAEALADVAGLKIAAIYNHHSEKRDISAAERGEVAEWVASMKVVATNTALRVTSGVFEVTGARARASKVCTILWHIRSRS
ncbi:MAG: hypothetical protein Q9171_003164 [Xanthocarpia ochracea]